MNAHVRHPFSSWVALDRLLARLERCAEACARLDAHRTNERMDDERPRRLARSERYAAYDRRVEMLADRIDREMDRLTSETLYTEVAEKRRRADLARKRAVA